MKTSTALVVIVIVALALGGLYWYSMQSYGTPVATPEPMPSGELGINGAEGQTNTGQINVPPVVVVASSTKLGNFLASTNGMTLYMFTKDATNTSTCKDQCAVNWPPYVVSTTEPLVAAEGVSGLLSTISRDDGSMQLTYNGMPLYFFKSDKNPGDTLGQAVNKVWYVVKP